MPQFTAVAHTPITVTAPDAETAEQIIRSLTDEAAEHAEASAPAADVTVARSTITGLRDTAEAAGVDNATLVHLIHQDAHAAINGALMPKIALHRIRGRAERILSAPADGPAFVISGGTGHWEIHAVDPQHNAEPVIHAYGVDVPAQFTDFATAAHIRDWLNVVARAVVTEPGIVTAPRSPR